MAYIEDISSGQLRVRADGAADPIPRNVMLREGVREGVREGEKGNYSHTYE